MVAGGCREAGAFQPEIVRLGAVLGAAGVCLFTGGAAMTNAPLLERMVDLTAIRDADLLDLSLLRTVREVCAAEELSLLRIAPDGRSMAETRLRDDGRCR